MIIITTSSSHAASSYGHDDLLMRLISVGADVNLRDADGDTPLLFSEQVSTYEILVANGADPTARNSAGQGIVEKVSEDENEEMIEYLIGKGILNDQEVIEKLRQQAFETQADLEAFLSAQQQAAELDGIYDGNDVEVPPTIQEEGDGDGDDDDDMYCT